VPEAGDDARVDYDKLIALCEASPAQRAPYENEAELIELLIGKWIDCRNSTGFHADQDGVWFREDKTWAALFFGPDATVRAGAGIDGTGEWDIYYEPDPGPQRPALSVGGGLIVRPAFTRDPFQLRNVSEAEDGTYLRRYVRLRDVLREPDAAIPAASCEEPHELPLLVKNARGELEPSAEGSGIVRCADGSMNRERAVRCPVIDDNAHCETDDDCEAGNVCRCATTALPSTACVPSNCASAADCASEECAAMLDGCGEPGAFYCRAETDQCRTEETCPPRWDEEGAYRLSALCSHSSAQTPWSCWYTDQEIGPHCNDE
jgi:hypothetical protein